MSKLKLLLLLLFAGVYLPAQTIKTSLVYLVNKPARVTPKTPVLIILHGYGSKETDSQGMAKIFQEKFIVFSLRAPMTTTTGGYCWFQMDFLPWKNFKSNYAQTVQSRSKVLAFISNACRAYKVDSTQVFVMGFSQGGMMAHELAVEAPHKIKGVLALSSRMMEETTVRHEANWNGVKNVKYFLVGGYSDPVISFVDAYKAHDFLRNKGVQDITIKFYDIPHTIVADEIQDLKNWMWARTAPVSN